MQALLKRDDKRKQNSKRTASTAPEPVKKKPSAANPKGLQVKPAAALPKAATGLLVQVEWQDGDKDKPKRNFVSKWYHKAQNAAEKAGKSTEDAKEAARAVHKAAAELYDKMQG